MVRCMYVCMYVCMCVCCMYSCFYLICCHGKFIDLLNQKRFHKPSVVPIHDSNKVDVRASLSGAREGHCVYVCMCATHTQLRHDAPCMLSSTVATLHGSDRPPPPAGLV
jgi:hypothetical protein